MAAGAAIGNRGGAAHHHERHHRRADHEGVIREGHHAGRADRCGVGRLEDIGGNAASQKCKSEPINENQ